jgi:murein DD-endopeptidase MepM/ murein hydrolase activator NlpD
MSGDVQVTGATWGAGGSRMSASISMVRLAMRVLLRLFLVCVVCALLGGALAVGLTRASLGAVSAQAHWRGPVRALPLDDVHVTSSFGRRGLSLHAGVDLRARTGTPVRAIDSGTVARADETRRAGKRVVLALDSGWRAGYAHLSRIDVKQRERVVAGQRIGLSGATGRVSGPHLHLELRAPTGKLVDPWPYLRAGQRALKRLV